MHVSQCAQLWGLGFGVWDLGLVVCGLEFGVSGSGCRVSGFVVCVSGLGFRTSGYKSTRLRVFGNRYLAQHLGLGR